jgi:hypothetical protein
VILKYKSHSYGEDWNGVEHALPLPGRRACSGRGLYAQDTPFDRAEQAAGLPSVQYWPPVRVLPLLSAYV